MAVIGEIKRAVEVRKCPGCSFRETQVSVELMRFDLDCPRCGRYKLSAFVPDLPPSPHPPRKRKAA